MREGWKSRWGWRISAVVLVGGLLALGTGTVVTQAGEQDDDHNQRNPFKQIMHKLDKILDAVKGGGSQDGNHTLRWDQALPAAQRFVILPAFNNEAVLDKNTGLVWERIPDAADIIWAGATLTCINKNVGGTKGWRLPSVAELAGLIDPSLPAPFVPTNIFPTLPQLGFFWSATTHAEVQTLAWDVGLNDSDVDQQLKTTPGHAWCVRGGMNADRY
jgi:Protein of unknown function (DUF1566)